MILNSLWLAVFVQNEVWSFDLSLLIILGMLATQIYIMKISTRNHLNNWEFVSLRIGFSIYTGWVTAATILNVCFVLKSHGFADPNAYLSEAEWCPVILWVALAIYWYATYQERNPAYGIVFIWVVIAIRDRHSAVEVIASKLLIIVALHFGYMLYVTGLCVKEKE